MDKKKVFKLATASTVAASAFLVAAPTQAAGYTVAQAEYLVNKAIKAQDSLRKQTTVYNANDAKLLAGAPVQINRLEKAIDNAKAAIGTLSKKHRVVLYAKLDDQKHGVQKLTLAQSLENGKNFDDAAKAATKVQAAKAAVQTKIDDASVAALEKAITDAHVAYGKVYGKFTRDSFRATHGTEVSKWLEAEKEKMTPKVASVSAINLKQIEVKLTQAVDKDTAVKTNFTVTGATVDTAVVSEDGKTVTLTLTSALTQKSDHTVYVSNLKTVTGAKFPSFVQDITVEDTVAPKISSAISVSKDDKVNSFTLKFSEPVSFTTIKVGDSILGASKVDDYTYTVSGKELEVGKSYEVEVYGLTDLAGNKGGTPERASIVVTKDAVKPNFSLNSAGPKTIEVKFDKDMNSAVAVDSIKVKNAKGEVVALSSLPTFKDDKRTLVVQLAAFPFADATANSATLDVTVQALQDKLGNVVEAKTSQVTLVRDSAKPAIKDAKFTTANEIEVEFSEAVTGVEKTDFFVNKADGTTATTVDSIAPVAGTNKYKLTLTGSLKNGSYGLVLGVNTVSDDSANTNAAQALTLTNDKETVTPVSPISATIVSAGVTSANKQVVITFDKTDVLSGINPTTGNLYVDGADNKALYSINGAALPQGAVINFYDKGVVAVGTDLTAGNDNDAVVIDLSQVEAKYLTGSYAAFANGGTATIAVGGVKNVAGATLSLTSLPVAVADKTAPTVTESYITGNATNGYSLTVKFSEALAATASADFVLAGKKDASTAAAGITLGTAVLATDGLSVTIPVSALGDADRTLGFTLDTAAAADLASTTDKAANILTEVTTPIAVTNFTTN
ncbi:hypothetical protein IHV12_04190 [Fictibacillus sp. 7GRE50]|uniref:hypothetical protein n=1 Tax=Fictibacillus sp. 7GRE50 TaxID=2745878 RepID=UPI0018CF7296|nr:hypothetical protein [Fictibacillus sp. 7GRE50]MBH0164100.1 hypothetical protein [Fictibacillus sp. 7GRE50]